VARLRTAVVGCGFFGSLHAKRYAGHPDSDLVAVVDTDPARAASVAAEHGVEPLTDYRALIGRVDAVSVATPANLHYEVARDLLAAGIHALVEKPMTHDLATARHLIEIAASSGAVLQIGLIENFSSAFRALKSVVDDPLYIEATRIAPWKARATDVDVVLDMMIHDIDVILGMVPSRVTSVEALGAPVLTRTEDIVNARLAFENGCVANVVASRVAVKTERKARVFQPDSYVVCDFAAGTLFRLDKAGDPETEGLAALRPDQQTIPKEDALDNEIAEFIAAARDRRRPVVDGERGFEALRVALMIKQSVAGHRALVESRRAQPEGPRP